MTEPAPRAPARPTPVRGRTPARGFARRRRDQATDRSNPRVTILVFVVGLAGLLLGGYLLLMRHVDPAVARAQVAAELRALPLEPGERLERTAFVFERSPWDYFRSSHGVLAATDRRLLVLTISPSDRFAREVERAVVERREFPKDTTLRIGTGRVMYGLLEGVHIEARGRQAAYAVAERDEPALRALIANVKQRQDSIYAAAEQARRMRTLLAEVMRQPIWYRIRRGDAVGGIAQRFNTTPERLREINNLQNDRIRVGDSIMIKPPTP